MFGCKSKGTVQSDWEQLQRQNVKRVAIVYTAGLNVIKVFHPSGKQREGRYILSALLFVHPLEIAIKLAIKQISVKVCLHFRRKCNLSFEMQTRQRYEHPRVTPHEKA